MKRILATALALLLGVTAASGVVHVTENYLSKDSNNFAKIPASAPLIEIFNTATKATAAATASTSVAVLSCTGFSASDQVYVGTNAGVVISGCTTTTMTLNTALTWAAWDTVILKRISPGGSDDHKTIYRESGLSTAVTQPFASDANGQWEFWIANGSYGTRVSDSGSSTLSTRITSYGADAVAGPGSSTDNAVARFNGTGGATLQNSGNTIDDSNNMVVAGDLTISGDDLTMGTNTTGAVLVGDSTNFNPVVMSGDASIAASGSVTVDPTTTNFNDVTWGANDEVILSWVWDTAGVNDPQIDFIATAGTLSRGGSADVIWQIGSGTSGGTLTLATGTDTDATAITTESTTTGKTAVIPDVSGMIMVTPANSTEGILIWADVDTRTTATNACVALGLTCSAGGVDPVDGTEFACGANPTSACGGSCTTASGYFYATCN